jgi:predicted transcriptional regulator
VESAGELGNDCPEICADLPFQVRGAMMSSLSECDLAEDRLKAFTRSAVRTKTILCLVEKEMDSGDLERKIGIRASTILHTLKDMIEEDLAFKSKRGYALTNIGRIQAMLLDDLVGAVASLNQHREFWLNHDLGGIPPELQKKIGMLAQSEIIKGSPETPLKSLEYFTQELLKSKEIYGVSPVAVTGYPDVIANSTIAGAKVAIILTDPVFKVIASEHKDLLRSLLQCDNFKLFRIDKDVKVSFTVTESFLNLALTRMDGSYDLSNDLVCTGDHAIAWGRMLFEFYRNESELIKKI